MEKQPSIFMILLGGLGGAGLALVGILIGSAIGNLSGGEHEHTHQSEHADH